MKTPKLLLLFACLTLWCATAFAHPNHGRHGNGLAEGLTHPLFGLDHLLAMFAVGLLAAQRGGYALWAIPCSFVGAMIAGGILGMAGLPMPAIEHGIALSILMLGAAVAVNRKLPLAVPLVAVAIFGCCHGHAHGAEAPRLASPALYAIGFVTATISLHIAGVLIGRLAIDSVRGANALRISGAAIALAGVYFLVR
jgi:urease accessory protein